MSQQKIYPKREIAYKKQNLEHNCVLQESCKTVRRWQRSILLVKGGHCVRDCSRLLSGWHIGERLCLKLLQQLLRHLSETCYMLSL